MQTRAINFIKLNPTGNMTILIKDKIPRAMQKDVANALLGFGNVCAEQAGFIEEAENPDAWARLQMMGGEFCGNATMSLAAVLARGKGGKGVKPGEQVTVPLEVSGADNIIDCVITVMDDHYIGRVKMPLPYSISEVDFDVDGCPYTGRLVHMPGISHLIVNPSELKTSKKSFTGAILAIAEDFTSQEALGVMFYGGNSLEPFVFVKPTNSKVWEHCCGSGSAAVAACAAFDSRNDMELEISQPGGTLRAFAGYNETITELWIEGVVRIVAEGTAYVGLA